VTAAVGKTQAAFNNAVRVAWTTIQSLSITVENDSWFMVTSNIEGSGQFAATVFYVRLYAAGPGLVITATYSGTGTSWINFDLSGSFDGAAGTHTVSIQVMNSAGAWSDWQNWYMSIIAYDK
jgi:hypothetical protein